MAIASKVAEVMGWNLSRGGHEPDQITSGEACVMEAVAYVAGLPLSDSPPCSCLVISAFLRSWNDSLSDDDRNRLLKPLIPDLVGTKSTEEVEQRRAYMAVDWLIRVHAPAWLDLAGLADHAKSLRDLEEIADLAGCYAAEAKTSAADSAARSAAYSAADSAAYSAAYSAARSAADSALKPTATALQASALDLVRRMIAAKPIAQAA